MSGADGEDHSATQLYVIFPPETVAFKTYVPLLEGTGGTFDPFVKNTKASMSENSLVSNLTLVFTLELLLIKLIEIYLLGYESLSLG